MAIEKVLVVDDEMLVRNFISETLRRQEMEVTTAENGKKALQLLKESAYDMVITDLKLPDLTGIELLCKIKELNPSTIVVIITAYGSIENTVEAMRLGAFHYIQKPFSAEVIEAVIERAKEHLTLIEENQYLRHQVANGGSRTAPKVIGESPLMKKILADVMQIAKSNASVFITGESGTGKEVIANTIHFNSLRTQKPFIKVNCAAVPDTLIESEFFGHERGAFTGANAKRLGRFELADGGSLLLDEVTEIPLSLQAKLLRVTQEQEFERVGGSKPIKVNVRLISTSNRDIKEAVANKTLRNDLYYRLNVVPIHLPPLRDRREDIIPLAEYFLERICSSNTKAPKQLLPEAKKRLLDYPWPGNIRELANIIERSVVLDSSSKITAEHLYLDSLKLSSVVPIEESKDVLPVGTTLAELEKRLIIETLEKNQNDRLKAAEMLGISPKVLQSKLQHYEL